MTHLPHSSAILASAKRALRMSVAAAAVVALSFGVADIVTGSGTNTIAAHAAPAPRLLEQGSPFSFADLVEQVSPAVVTVVVEREQQRQNGPSLDDIPAPFRDFFRQ